MFISHLLEAYMYDHAEAHSNDMKVLFRFVKSNQVTSRKMPHKNVYTIVIDVDKRDLRQKCGFLQFSTTPL